VLTDGKCRPQVGWAMFLQPVNGQTKVTPLNVKAIVWAGEIFMGKSLQGDSCEPDESMDA
jgi:hypothetical protein